MTMTSEDEEFEPICGESFDHDIVITYEDEELVQWYCDNCGAEGWDDLLE